MQVATFPTRGSSFFASSDLIEKEIEADPGL